MVIKHDETRDFSKVSAVVSSSGAHKMNSWRPSHQENGT
jgi:hypothetical protein